MLVLEHGKPMIFGKDRDKGIRLRGLHPEVVKLGERRSPRPTCSSTTRRGSADRLPALAHVLAGLPGPGRGLPRMFASDPR